MTGNPQIMITGKIRQQNGACRIRQKLYKFLYRIRNRILYNINACFCPFLFKMHHGKIAGQHKEKFHIKPSAQKRSVIFKPYLRQVPIHNKYRCKETQQFYFSISSGYRFLPQISTLSHSQHVCCIFLLIIWESIPENNM